MVDREWLMIDLPDALDLKRAPRARGRRDGQAQPAPTKEIVAGRIEPVVDSERSSAVILNHQPRAIRVRIRFITVT
jgi:hypothetical protein